MKNLNHKEAVILGLLSQLQRGILRTNLVKLIYLLDNAHFEHLGETMTGFTYHWDRYGPNAVGNAIIETVWGLSKKGLVCESQSPTPYESPAFNYAITEKVDKKKLPLTDTDWVFIKAISKKYGRMSRTAIVRESKNTSPMKGVEQFAVLSFRENGRIKSLKDSFFADAAFVEQTTAALAASGNPMTLEELRLAVG